MDQAQGEPPIEEPWWSRHKWFLAAGLALGIALIIVGVVLATQPASKRDARPTSTLTPTSTPKPQRKPTATPSPKPTLSPTHTPPPTPASPSPTPTPSLTPIPTVTGLSLGYVHRPGARIAYLQAQASAKQPGYAFYLNSVKVLSETLGSYGFTGRWMVIQPSQPSPTPTVSPRPYTTPNRI